MLSRPLLMISNTHNSRSALAIGVSLAVVAALLNRASDGAEKPNIIFIMADDLGYADLGCYGQKEILTPNIDRLAGEGRKFSQCYAGSTVCAPSRSCLMTGTHTGHTTVRGNFAKVGGVPPQGLVPLEPDAVTVAEVLKTAGYTTGITGKWGLGEPGTTGIPNRQGFDEWFGYLNQRNAHTYYPPHLWRNEERVPLAGNLDGKQQDYTHDLFTEFALEFIERNREGPFFLYLPYTIPHSQYEVPSDAPYSDRTWSAKLKNYAAMVTRMDGDVGRIMVLLKKLGIDNDTVVFFTSDNGAAFDEETFNSAGHLRGKKRDMYEGGIRVPMIVRWPGQVEPGTTSDHVWAFWDFLPTAADLAGTERPESDGISALPAILGREQPSHDYLYWEFFERGFSQAIRRGNWKAVRNRPGKPIELYDLANDESEETDVAGEYPEVVAQIGRLFETARSDSPYWPLGK